MLQHMVQPNKFNYTPKSNAKSKAGFVGLKNLGNICYLNSVVQQFYHVPEVRRGLLLAGMGEKKENKEEKKEKKEKKENKEEKKENQEEKKENQGENKEEHKEEHNTMKAKDNDLLYQVQSLFAHLSHSNRQYYVPKGLCHSFKDRQGNSVDVKIQKDATEFFGDFLDKLEDALKEKKKKKKKKNQQRSSGEGGGSSGTTVLDRFKGTTVTQISHNGKSRYSSQVNPTLQLVVHNIKTMKESFQMFKEPENLEDFNFDDKTPNVRVTAQKRSLLGVMPPTLVIQCNRFVFNFDTFLQEKLNSRFEFDRCLNLEEHTVEGTEWREWDAKYGNDGLGKGGKGGDQLVEKQVEKQDEKQDASQDASQETKQDASQETKQDAPHETKQEAPQETTAPPPRPPGQYVLHPKEYYEYDLVGIVVHAGKWTFLKRGFWILFFLFLNPFLTIL